MRIPIDPDPENVLAWEIFRISLDQWNMNGGFDFHLAIELLKAYGCDGGEIIEEVRKIRIISAVLQEIRKIEQDEEASRQEFYKQQSKDGVLRH